MTRLAELRFEDRGDVVVASVKGELDLSNAADVTDALSAAVADAAAGLALDLLELRHIDSAGVRLLFELRARLARRRQALTAAVGPDAPIREVLELAAVGDAMPVLSTVDEAVAALRS